MSSLLLAAVALGALASGYVFYGKRVTRWLDIDPDITPPAEELNDGVDYVPARHWSILFGHHFASIAGAAPIIGPVIACMIWGWLPAVLWIVFGGIFFGAVHDYFSLMFSVEHKGRSVSDLSGAVLGQWAKVAFSIFALLALILVVAVFIAVAGKTLAGQPQVVLPTFGLIVVAVLVGVLVYHTKTSLALATAIGLALLFGLIVLGYFVPISLPTENAARWWMVILIVYAMVAAVLPVSLLLQPRDHLSVGVLVLGMFFGFAGILISRPAMQSPHFIAFGGTAQGGLWPMMFVVIACGAISGFHSLVASGTTSKQLPRIRDGRRIGYGAMIMESALGVLALIAVAAGLHWTTPASGDTSLVYPALMGDPKQGWLAAFGAGYGELTRPIFGALGMLIGITMLKTFVMTTLDSATRIARYLFGELFGDTFGIKPLKNRYVGTVVIGACSLALALGNWKAIWPIFGSANQLIASMVLTVATVYLLSRGRRWIFAAVPAALIFVTATAALVYKLIEFIDPDHPNVMLAAVAAVLLILDVYITVKAVTVFRRIIKRPTTTPRSTPGQEPL